MCDNATYRTTNFVLRGGKLYDKIIIHLSFDPQTAIKFDIVWKWDYEELPSVFKRYITLRASGRAATQLVANPQFVQLLEYTRGTSSELRVWNTNVTKVTILSLVHLTDSL